MKKGFFASALWLFTGAGIALGQSTAPSASLGPPTSPVTRLGSPESKPSSPVARLGYTEGSPSASPLGDRSVWQGDSGRPTRFWGSAEYLLWWTKGNSVPPLVTTGPALPIAPPPGSFAAPGTVVLFGGDERSRNPFSGGRFTLGFWWNDCQNIGAEANFFFLGQRSNDFNAATSGAPGSIALARPFFDTSTGTANSELVGYPGLAAGSIRVHSTSQLLGGESNLLFNLCRSCDVATCNPCDRPDGRYRVDLLAGFRVMELREGLGVAENTQVNPGAPFFAGNNINAFDQFDTRNRFYGPQLGIRTEWWRNRVFVNATGKIALGDTHQTVDINGSTRVTTPAGAAVVIPGNLLALPSNIGHYSRDQFSVVPEFGLNVGYQVTRNLRVFAGYTFIYWSNVERPGDAINPRVNSTRVPTSVVPPTGPLDPQFGFRNSNYWAQGVNLGIQLRY